MSEQTPLDKTLASIFESEQWDIEGQRDKLKKVYEALPQYIQQISDATGIAPDKIVKYAKFTAFNNNNVKVHDVIRIIRDFYVFKDNDEKGMYEGK
jgi:hypothetical protein